MSVTDLLIPLYSLFPLVVLKFGPKQMALEVLSIRGISSPRTALSMNTLFALPQSQTWISFPK